MDLPPFDGVRVIDFSRVIAGPYASEQLALLGADIVKIEQPGPGDDGRGMSTDPSLSARRVGSIFLGLNAGKRSLALDLKHPRAKEVVHRLVAGADVVLQNFRPGVTERLGFDYESLKAVAPKIVYCSISGFGQEGPGRGAPAYDGRIQATSGMMSITGHPETGPVRAGFPVCDAATGMTAAYAIAAALFRRERTGEGTHLDVAMLDTTLSFMSPVVTEVLVGGQQPELTGNLAGTRNPTANVFPTGDGELLLSCNTDRQFVALCNTLGREDLSADPRYATVALRTENSDTLIPELTRAFAAAGAAEWEERLTAAGVPSGRVRSVAEALQHVQVAHRKLVLDLPETPGLGRPSKALNAPFKMAGAAIGTDRAAPGVGQHTEEILREIGYGDAELRMLREENAIPSP